MELQVVNDMSRWPPRRKFRTDEADFPDYSDGSEWRFDSKVFFLFWYFVRELRLANRSILRQFPKNPCPGVACPHSTGNDPSNPENPLNPKRNFRLGSQTQRTF